MKRKYKILFPSEPYNIRQIDSTFEAERNISQLCSFEHYMFDFDTFTSEQKLVHNIDFNDECILIYRGWMLKPEDYRVLFGKVLNKSKGSVKLINLPMEYENCHCFPNVYENIKEYTPRIEKNLAKVDFDFFLKDYVKSTKTDEGVEMISKDINAEELKVKVDRFIEDRAHLFTGEVIAKEFVSLKEEKGKTNEWRAFYFNGKVHAVLQNSYLETKEEPPVQLVKKVGEAIGEKSNFFTVDFALTEDDRWIVIEAGDGQVSGLCEGQELKFYNRLRKLII